jgi:hypothetical protein
MKLEKFDLEKALNGAKVITGGGLAVTQLTKFKTVDNWNLYGIMDNEVHCWNEQGTHKDSCSNVYDLCIGVEVQSVWVNLYTTIEGGIMLGHCYKIKEDAEYDGKSNSSYIKTIEITDEV